MCMVISLMLLIIMRPGDSESETPLLVWAPPSRPATGLRARL